MNDAKIYDDSSLKPAEVITADLSAYSVNTRVWQGIPGICWAGGDRLLATWYSGGKNEGPDNYVIVARSDDFGKTWREPVGVVAPEGNVRAFDSTLWRSPDGRVWLFWAQGWSPMDIEIWDGRVGVWCSVCDDPQADELAWSFPRRIDDGIMLNKPCVTTQGTWLLPVAIWDRAPFHPSTQGRRLAGVVASHDNGQTFQWLGGAKMLDDAFNEHVIFERDNDYVIWARTRSGIAESISSDGGVTWTNGVKNSLDCPDSRFNVALLADGKLLLITHFNPDLKLTTYIEAFGGQCWPGRNNLTAMLSEDKGKTWNAIRLIDERQGVSYPDIDVTPDGRIVTIYDYDRYENGEIIVVTMGQEGIIGNWSLKSMIISKLM